MFQQVFKYYKSKNPPPSFADVLDLHIRDDNPAIVRNVPAESKSINNQLKNSSEWQIYEIQQIPGLLYIENPFTQVGQQYWIRECLEKFTTKPNKLNIDAANILPENCNWWNYAQTNIEIRKKLRWATLGYHHNWDTKVYSSTEFTVFPSNLHELCAHFAHVLQFEDNFNAEAAIVNFYHMNSTLSGHVDHSENCLNAPLFSFSFGNSAIFLIGGKTLEEKPLPLFLHSGDVLIMSGESRLSYHAVPRIVKTQKIAWFTHDMNESGFQPFADYLETSRININVRQVLRNGQKHLEMM